ncbi:cytochrome c1 [Croceicoccus sp. YJ47]|uniref:cytochrome c1 n=1 Tax=Croceicoccus sp. YJ47 TaxID=2798724 RepID=UPI001922E5B0|nr:cytochrome c1 [Croceicoccus sp. YJ47]QQN73068.1 cytochrome c1 [Croceicoccus sp. YJ47]
MARIIGILVGAGFCIVLLYSFIVGAYTWATDDAEETAEHVFHLHPRDAELQSAGWFGTFDEQQLQRGYKVYKEVCSACHSLRLVSFRNLEALGYSEAQVKAEAAAWQVPGIDPGTGEATTRPALPTDYFPSPYPNDVAARAANNNAVPPDLSLITKARHDGSNYVYSLLTGYRDPATFSVDGESLAEEFPDFATPSGLHFNPYFPNLNLAMAPPLTSDGQVTFDDGSPAGIDDMARDVSAFLTWTAEPKLEQRHQTGWPVVLFLIFASILAYMAYQNVWRDKKH